MICFWAHHFGQWALSLYTSGLGCMPTLDLIYLSEDSASQKRPLCSCLPFYLSLSAEEGAKGEAFSLSLSFKATFLCVVLVVPKLTLDQTSLELIEIFCLCL